MIDLIRELLCWFKWCHLPTRRPFIVNNQWRTRIRCWCGRMDIVVDGLPDHPRTR